MLSYYLKLLISILYERYETSHNSPYPYTHMHYGTHMYNAYVAGVPPVDLSQLRLT